MWLHHRIILWWHLFTTWLYDSVTKIQYRIVWQRSFITLGDCQEYFLSGKTTLPHYFGPVLSLFSLLQGQKWNFLSKAVQYRYFPALLLLDKKVWEVAQHVFCYCLYTNLSHFQRFCSSFNESKPHFSMSHCTERYRSEEISPHVSSTCKV